jgi:hypothetical protein
VRCRETIRIEVMRMTGEGGAIEVSIAPKGLGGKREAA